MIFSQCLHIYIYNSVFICIFDSKPRYRNESAAKSRLTLSLSLTIIRDDIYSIKIVGKFSKMSGIKHAALYSPEIRDSYGKLLSKHFYNIFYF